MRDNLLDLKANANAENGSPPVAHFDGQQANNRAGQNVLAKSALARDASAFTCSKEASSTPSSSMTNF